jgi:murein DD-endopeptidase MepM/ murein hydrolase activator NlpD
LRKVALFTSVIAATSLALGGSAYAWTKPVTAPISDNWRPPANKYGPGNRGVDFATAPNTPVKSAGPGTVSFAGQVGGTLYVVVDHGEGLRTTYGGLTSIAVAGGQEVQGGTVVGVAGADVHFGVRSGDDYVDPNSLFGGVHLVPLK